ncbi:transcriptional regulator [Pseudoduganella sp. LjRoot289]|uniref:transcriptional regulator n=1 Tax=Pseudoduganella sp. LjRoot289 TaxID=3342314 RepID=UPI003ED0D9F4
MKPHFVISAALAAVSVLALAQQPASLPEPWIVAGESPKMYEAGIDLDGSASGSKGAKYLRQAKGDGSSWGTLMQQFSAEAYRGKRVRFQADVMTHSVSKWAGLWMRVDSPAKYSSSFYNSQDKPMKGTMVWERRSVVLDVAEDATAVSLGVISAGTGETFIDKLSVEVVGKDVPVDVFPARRALPQGPSL